jgi:hypothetical protein
VEANAISHEPHTPGRFGLTLPERQRIDTLIRHASADHVDVTDRLRHSVGIVADRARTHGVPPEQLLAALKDTFKAASGRGDANERELLERVVTWCIARYYAGTSERSSSGERADSAGGSGSRPKADSGRAD